MHVHTKFDQNPISCFGRYSCQRTDGRMDRRMDGRTRDKTSVTFQKFGTGNTKIEVCGEEKDLGVTFDSKLSFDQHIQTIVSKANQMLGLIKRTFSYLDKDK